MATRLPYAQGESGNVVIVGTCLDIARTSGRECRASSVSGTRSSQFTRFSRTAWRSPRNAGSTWSESRRNFQISSWANCIQWHCGEDTLWSASAPAPNFVWPLWSHSLCASGASPPQDCSSFPIPCKFHLYESACCETMSPMSHLNTGLKMVLSAGHSSTSFSPNSWHESSICFVGSSNQHSKRCCFLLLSERYFMLLRAQKTFEAYGRLVAALGLYLIFVFLRPMDSSSQWKIYKHLLIEKSREISLRIFKILNIQCCNVSLSESRPKKQFFKPRLFASCPRQGESKQALFQKLRCSKGYWKENQNIWRTKENKEWRKILKGAVSFQPAKQSTVMVYDMDPDEIGNQVSTENPNSQAGTWRARMMGVKSTSLAMLWTNCTRSIQLNENFLKQQAQKNIQSTNVPNKPLPSVWVSWCLQSPDNLWHFCTSLPQFLQDLKSWNMWNLELMEHSSTHSTPPVYFVRFVQIRRDLKIADLKYSLP